MSTKNENDKIIKVARYFILKSEKEREADQTKNLSPLKLQKLLYYAKAWNLVLNNGNKLFPENFEAWIHGPANFKVWEYFRNFNFEDKHSDLESDSFKAINDKEKEILDMVWAIYGKFDGKYLEKLTHSEDPWLKARQDLNENIPSQNVITDESMKSYYEQRIKTEA